MQRYVARRAEKNRRRSRHLILKPDSLVIRNAAAADSGRVAALDQKIFAAAAYNAEQWQAEFAANAVVILVAETPEGMAGFLSATQTGDEWEIRKIGVLPALRQQGIARQLLAELFAKTPAGRRCLLEVSVANAPAILFYQALGFGEIHRRRRYYADGSDAIVMEKILSAP